MATNKPNYDQEYYLKNKDKINARNRERNANLPVSLVDRAKTRAKTKGVVCTVLPEEIEVPEFCPILPWIKLERASKSFQDQSPSLDRIVPSEGYTVTNSLVMSNRANILKRDATLDELIALGEWAKKIKEEYGNG